MKKLFLLFLFFTNYLFAIPADKVPVGETAVVDMVNLLNPKAKDEIEVLLRNYYQQGLMQGAVVIVDKTEGKEIFDYAMDIFKRWKLGDKTKNNGLLMLIAFKERKFFTLTGLGLEGALPDISVGKINREKLVPAFKSENYTKGIKDSLNAYAQRLKMDSKSLKKAILKDKKGKITSSTILKVLLGIWVILLVISSVVLAVIDSRINEPPKQKNFVKLLTLVLLLDFSLLSIIYNTFISFGDLFGLLFILACPFAVFIFPYIPREQIQISGKDGISSSSSISSFNEELKIDNKPLKTILLQRLKGLKKEDFFALVIGEVFFISIIMDDISFGYSLFAAFSFAVIVFLAPLVPNRGGIVDRDDRDDRNDRFSSSSSSSSYRGGGGRSGGGGAGGSW